MRWRNCVIYPAGLCGLQADRNVERNKSIAIRYAAWLISWHCQSECVFWGSATMFHG